MAFKFDPNSTVNQGRWRLRDPNDFDKNKYITRKLKTGISYILGVLLEHSLTHSSEYTVQAIRFNKNIWTEENAALWWKENKHKYVKTWKEKDWKKIIDEENKGKIDIKEGIKLCKEIARILKIKFVSAGKITIDTKFTKDIIFPVGSIRRKKPMIKDIDLFLTTQVYKENLKAIKKFTNLSGGEKRIDFDYKGIRVNLFVFLNKDTFGCALAHSTGNYILNLLLRQKVKKNGWKLSQNGLINEKGELIITETERDLFEAIGSKIRLPNDREL